MQASDLFTWSDSLPFTEHFADDSPPWEWVPAIARALAAFDWLRRGDSHSAIPETMQVSGKVYIHPTVRLPRSAIIEGPAYIGAHCEIRPNAYIRGNVIAGTGCVLGHASEFKNCLLLDGVQVPHFNYVGDSVLGRGAHLGAGVILANLRLDKKEVPVQLGDERHMSGLGKLGGLLGDEAEVGCNAVLQPGTVLGRRSLVTPAMSFGGYLEPGTIVRVRQELARIRRPNVD